MPKEKYLIVSNCRFDRKWFKKGQTVELDSDDSVDMDKIALLNHAGRLGLATPHNIKAIEAEIESEKANDARLAEMNRRLSGRAASVTA